MHRHSRTNNHGRVSNRGFDHAVQVIDGNRSGEAEILATTQRSRSRDNQRIIIGVQCKCSLSFQSRVIDASGRRSLHRVQRERCTVSNFSLQSCCGGNRDGLGIILCHEQCVPTCQNCRIIKIGLSRPIRVIQRHIDGGCQVTLTYCSRSRASPDT